MKSRFEIKDNAEQLIKTNNLWITIGLIPTIASLLVVTNQIGENMTLNQLNIPLSIVISFFEVGSMLYIYDIVNEHKDIPQGFKNQFKEIINSITQKSFMDGKKQNRFMLSLSFIPWILLSLITMGLANIYVIPYMLATDAIYANEVIKNKN